MWTYNFTFSVVVIIDSVTGTTCFITLQTDSVKGDFYRWALPSDSHLRCSCTKILAKPFQPSCGSLHNGDIDGYWFTDHPGLLVDRNVWNTEELEYLLDCGKHVVNLQKQLKKKTNKHTVNYFKNSKISNKKK